MQLPEAMAPPSEVLEVGGANESNFPHLSLQAIRINSGGRSLSQLQRIQLN